MTTATTEPQSQSDPIRTLQLEEFLDHQMISLDQREGVLWNPAKARVCMLSGDLIAGIYEGLEEEAGPAWAIILNNCGRLWGGRVARRLSRETEQLLGAKLPEMTIERFIQVFEGYFHAHGWGGMHVDIGKAQSHGLIEARLDNSVFAAVIKDEDEMSDAMITGMLAAMISFMADRDLDCVQTVCPSRGADASRFIITLPDRIKQAGDMVSKGKGHDEIVEAI